ncbi:terpene synthase-like [Hylaeus volcanicus]|uniref:terpene synthase-like n=1 Tax=Hylaeus volcanicus TaxID=313075 RepID=UPI0023B81783|nr:terpene synthase-like [Hylaeus volcanicus]
MHDLQVMFYKAVTTVRSVSSIAPRHVYSHDGDKKEDQALLAPINYVYQACSKGTTLEFNNAFNYWLKVPQNKFDEIQDAIQILYNVTLMVDDIQDSSALRSTVPAAHHLYEIGATISCALYAVNIVYEKINALNHPEALRVFLDVLNTLYRGQGTEIYWRDNYICPSETEYRKMADGSKCAITKCCI